MKKRSVKKAEETTEFETLEDAKRALRDIFAEERRKGILISDIAVTFFRGASEGIRAAVHPDTVRHMLAVKRSLRRDGFEPLGTIGVDEPDQGAL